MPKEAAGAAGYPEAQANQNVGIQIMDPNQRRSVAGDQAYYWKRTHPQTVTQALITANGTYPSATFPTNIIGLDVDSIPVEGYLYHSVQVTGTFNAASIQTQGSLDGVNYTNIGAAITTAAMFALNAGGSFPLKNIIFVITSVGASTSLTISVTSTR